MTGESTRLGSYPTAQVLVGAARQTPQGTQRDLMNQSLWPPRGAWVPLPDGSVAVIHPQPYHVEMIRPDGATIRGPDVEYQPVRVTAALRQSKGWASFMGHPYTCDGKQAPFLSAVCNPHTRVVQYRGGRLIEITGEWLNPF